MKTPGRNNLKIIIYVYQTKGIKHLRKYQIKPVSKGFTYVKLNWRHAPNFLVVTF